jgi:hypothetical protein
MAAQLNAAGEEQGPATIVPDTSTQRREDVPHRIEHANKALQTDSATTGATP